MGHADPRTTSHYLDSLSVDEAFDVNKHLVKRGTKQVEAGDLDGICWNQGEKSLELRTC